MFTRTIILIFLVYGLAGLLGEEINMSDIYNLAFLAFIVDLGIALLLKPKNRK